MQTITFNHQTNTHTSSNTINHIELINQLRRQNQILKKQISSLMNSQPNHTPCSWTTNIPQAIQITPIRINPQPSNLEDEVQVTYRNKISKLKMKKSPRNSTQKFQTAQNSPRVSYISPTNRLKQQKHHFQDQTLFLPKTKMMVVSKDKQNKFCRINGQQDSCIKNNFNHYKPYQNFQNRSSEPSPSHQNAKKKSILGHFRTISNQQSQNNCFQQPTERKYQVKNIPSPFKKTQPYKQQTNKSMSKYQLAQSKQILVKMHQPYRIEQSVVPKGNVYFQTAEFRQDIRKENCLLNTQQTDERGDSQLSIQVNLRKLKSNRTLKYDIYMQEQKKY